MRLLFHKTSSGAADNACVQNHSSTILPLLSAMRNRSAPQTSDSERAPLLLLVLLLLLLLEVDAEEDEEQ